MRFLVVVHDVFAGALRHFKAALATVNDRRPIARALLMNPWVTSKRNSIAARQGHIFWSKPLGPTIRFFVGILFFGTDLLLKSENYTVGRGHHGAPHHVSAPSTS